MGPDHVVMGIDYSSKALHCAYGQEHDPYRQVVKVEGQLSESRIAAIYDELSKLFDRIEKRWDPSLSLLVVERPFLHHNRHTAIILAQMESAVMTTAHAWKWQVMEIDPSEIRRQVLGVGTTGKKGGIKVLAQEYVRREHGLDLDPDTADSIVIYDHARFLIETYLSQTTQDDAS